jgi:hypothetical protein
MLRQFFPHSPVSKRDLVAVVVVVAAAMQLIRALNEWSNI